MEFIANGGKILKPHFLTMPSLLSESENVVANSGSLPAVTVKPKLRPVAGIASPAPAPAAPKLAAEPTVNGEAPPAPAAALQAQTRSMVFTADGPPTSPWTAGVVRIPQVRQEVPTKPVLGTPAELPDADDGIEGVRKLLFGRHMSEMQTKVAELHMALAGEMKRLREALMNRVDEMSGYLHRDMVVLRNEMQREMAQMKTDLFAAATALSSVKDRVLSVETKAREEVVTALTEIDCRLARQESAFTSALDQIETKLGRTLDSKCGEALAVFAKKSEIAELLTQMGTLVGQQTPGVELGWFSAECPPAAPVAPPSAAEAGKREEATLDNPSVEPLGDWPSSIDTFMPSGGLIT